MKWGSFLLLLGDILLALAALAAAHLLRFWSQVAAWEVFAGWTVQPAVFVVAVLMAGYFLEIYGLRRTAGSIELVAAIAVSMTGAFFLLSAIYYVFPSLMIGRGLLSLSLLIFGVFQFFWHRGLKAVLKMSALADRVLILGVGSAAAEITTVLKEAGRNELLVGYIQPENEVVAVPQDEIIGGVEDIVSLVEKHRAHRLVIAMTERRGALPVREILRCKLNGVEVVDAPTYYEEAMGKLLIENIQPSWFLFSDGFRITPIMRIYKRAIDVTLSSLGILLTLPVMPFVALAIKLDSQGPVFFKQVRVGEGEKNFLVLKFRTMRQDAEKHSGAVWVTEDDPRITRVGNFLRKSRLDEIPQLFNVFKGEMSFVGPRPERPEFVERLKQTIPFYSKRHFVKPGVTGWAQVRYPYGASEKDALEKLRFDLYHMKNWSILLDLMIILETVKVCAFGRGGR